MQSTRKNLKTRDLVGKGSLPGSKTKTAYHLSFYQDPPNFDIELDEFETHGIARLQVLRRIDVLRARGITGDKFTEEIRKADKKHLSIHPKTQAKDVKRDIISHFALRMAYYQTEEKRRWFLSNECELFAFRFKDLKKFEVDSFLQEQGIRYQPIDKVKKERLRPKLMAVSTMSLSGFESTEFYKVPFTDVLDLVAKREVLVEAGSAYVSHTSILSIVEGRYRASLSKSLALASQKAAITEEDNRITPITRMLSRIAFRYGAADISGQVDDNGESPESVVNIFCDFLTSTLGHSDPKKKMAGASKMFVSVGTRKANERDRTCPIAGRVHKSNTQKYTIYFDTKVMMQGCWDGVCQATNRHVFYQIQDGRCVEVGWNPPPLVGPSSQNSSPLQAAKPNQFNAVSTSLRCIPAK